MGTDQSKPVNQPGVGPSASGGVHHSPANIPGAAAGGSQQNATRGTLREEDIPYTSYGKNQSQDQGIVIVSTNPFASYNDVEPELLALQKIPFFTPLLKNSGFNIGDFFSSGKDPSSLDVLKPDAILALCQVYQHHMKKISAEVAHDQKLLTTNIKQLESFCTKVTQTMVAKHQQAQYYSEHLKAVPQILQLLEKTNAQASKAIKSLEFLNNMLPVEERLEPISVHIPYHGEYRTSLPQAQDDPGEVSEVYVKQPSTSTAKEPTPTTPEEPSPSPAETPEVKFPEVNRPSGEASQEGGSTAAKEPEQPPPGDRPEESSEGAFRDRSKSTGGSTEYSSESSGSRKFRADLVEESERGATEEDLVVHTSKPGKKKKKTKKPVEIS